MTRFKWGTVSDRTVQVPESRAFDFGVGWFVVCFFFLLLFVFWRDGGMSLFLRMRLMGGAFLRLHQVARSPCRRGSLAEEECSSWSRSSS